MAHLALLDRQVCHKLRGQDVAWGAAVAFASRNVRANVRHAMCIRTPPGGGGDIAAQKCAAGPSPTKILGGLLGGGAGGAAVSPAAGGAAKTPAALLEAKEGTTPAVENATIAVAKARDDAEKKLAAVKDARRHESNVVADTVAVAAMGGGVASTDEAQQTIQIVAPCEGLLWHRPVDKLVQRTQHPLDPACTPPVL